MRSCLSLSWGWRPGDPGDATRRGAARQGQAARTSRGRNWQAAATGEAAATGGRQPLLQPGYYNSGYNRLLQLGLQPGLLQLGLQPGYYNSVTTRYYSPPTTPRPTYQYPSVARHLHQPGYPVWR